MAFQTKFMEKPHFMHPVKKRTMKKIALHILFFSLAACTSGQNIHQEVAGGGICDTIFCTRPEYPVRLMNDISELQKILSDQLTLYPEDFEKSGQLTYEFTISCNGINIGSCLRAHKGIEGGIAKRILKILDENCIWDPAIHFEKPVNSFYHLTIDLQKGKISVLPQNKNEK